MRAYKTVNDSYIEPISFTVPRRSEVFQSDIYPPATGTKPGVSAAEWFSGKSALPPKIDLESVYEGNAPAEIPADYKPPTPAAAPAPVKPASPAKKEPEPQAVAQRAPPPTLVEQKNSMSAMASKFQDNDPEDDEDDDSSFEEISRPVVRSQPKPEPIKASSPIVSRPAVSSPVSQFPKSTQAAAAASAPAAVAKVSTPSPVSASPVAGTGSVENTLEQIKKMLEAQTKTITAQSEKIGHLASEVDTLKRKVGGGSQDQSERIRQLELELEAARS
jgi:coronin-1B/1C/6